MGEKIMTSGMYPRRLGRRRMNKRDRTKATTVEGMNCQIGYRKTQRNSVCLDLDNCDVRD